MNEKIRWADRIRQRTAGAGADIATLHALIGESHTLDRLKQHLREIDNVATEIMHAGSKEFLATKKGQEYIDEFERIADDLAGQQRDWE